MKKLIIIFIVLFSISACSSNTSGDLPDHPTDDQVQEGFEDFLKDKEQQDEQKMQEELAQAQQRPVTFEKEQLQVKISIPQSLIDDYGPQITQCFQGTGSEEKIRAKGEYCVTQLAANNDEPNICKELLEIGEKRDKCYQAIAKEQSNSNYCDLIKSDASKQACFEFVK